MLSPGTGLSLKLRDPAETRAWRLADASASGLAPGDPAPETGLYQAIGTRGGLGVVVNVFEGDLMPEAKKGSLWVRYRIED